jgi:hypothetical protein
MKLGLTTALVWALGIGMALLAWGGQTAPQPPTLTQYNGILQSVDVLSRTITVQGEASVARTFYVPFEADILVKAKPRGELADLRPGDGIRVKYTEESGLYVAYEVAPLNLKNP